MLLYIRILTIFEYSRCHISVLNPVISKNRRREILPQIHMMKPLGVLKGDLIVTGPKYLLLLIGKTPDPDH